MQITLSDAEARFLKDAALVAYMDAQADKARAETIGMGEYRERCDVAEAIQERLAHLLAGHVFRTAKVTSDRSTLAEVRQYMPGSYTARHDDEDGIVIEGWDHNGFTLDEYVIPRLASGLHVAVEVTS